MRATAFVLMFMGAVTAQAGEESYGPTQSELAMLPPYCGGPGGQGVDWARYLGQERVWNNHTCYGINRINRYYSARRTGEKKYHLQLALQDLDYSVNHLSQRFPLMPEILYYRGLVHKLQSNFPGAMMDWQKSIEMDKRYVRSIVELADLYAQQMKKPAQALELVTDGLRDNPDSKALQNRYTRYGGKLPYPQPRVPEPVAAKADGKSADKPPEKAKSRIRPQDVYVPPVIGTTENPWCRFCPEPAPSKDPASSKP